jgi:hypothetical protein
VVSELTEQTNGWLGRTFSKRFGEGAWVETVAAVTLSKEISCRKSTAVQQSQIIFGCAGFFLTFVTASAYFWLNFEHSSSAYTTPFDSLAHSIIGDSLLV